MPFLISSEGEYSLVDLGLRSGCGGYEVESEVLGFALQALDGALTGLFFVIPLTWVHVLGLVLEH